VARAKRTERAEARRRYRAAAVADPESGTETEDGPEPSAKAARSTSSQASKSSAGSSVRVGFAEAFRQSFRPMHVREDIATIPWIAVHTKALWLPLLITLASTIYIIATSGKDTISQFMFAYFIQTPAIGGVFLAGFLAPRSSWLLGVIVGFVSAICYGILVLFYPGAIYVGAPPTEAQAREVAISALILSPIIGSFFAAGAAWYRRFLALSSPNRGRKPSQTAKQKPGDGRTRSGTTQKASAKR
jgi:hypothetical protein